MLPQLSGDTYGNNRLLESEYSSGDYVLNLEQTKELLDNYQLINVNDYVEL